VPQTFSKENPRKERKQHHKFDVLFKAEINWSFFFFKIVCSNTKLVPSDVRRPGWHKSGCLDGVRDEYEQGHILVSTMLQGMKREEIPPFGVLNQHECWCCFTSQAFPPIPTTDSSNVMNASFYHNIEGFKQVSNFVTCL
jgi:hypothetical protein